MVVAEPDGAPELSVTPRSATWRTHSSAIVGLTDGRLTVYDAAGKLLLDEYAPARRLTPVTVEGQPWLATRRSSTAGPTRALRPRPAPEPADELQRRGRRTRPAQHGHRGAVPAVDARLRHPVGQCLDHAGGQSGALRARIGADWRAEGPRPSAWYCIKVVHSQASTSTTVSFTTRRAGPRKLGDKPPRLVRTRMAMRCADSAR